MDRNIKKDKVLKIKKAVLLEGRFYLQDRILNEKTKFKPGVSYQYLIDQTKKLIEILPSPNGSKIVSKRSDQQGNVTKSVIDIRNEKIKAVLTGCEHVTITISENRIVVVGFRPSIQLRGWNIEGKKDITSMTFCAGGGISAYFSREAGFREMALLEYNPSDQPGQWEKYANIAEWNHPEAIMYNLPIETFSASMLPDEGLDVWMITLPCNDYSLLKIKKAQWDEDGRYPSIHHFLHVVRIFTETPDNKKPACIFCENVPTFAKVVGKSLELFFRDQGYYVSSAVLDSADYGSRMHRQRWYMCANVVGEFKFPEPTGRQTTPMAAEAWFNLEDFEWEDATSSKSIRRLLSRRGRQNSLNIKAIDPALESISYTIPKNYRISVPQGMIKHPKKDDTYAVFPPQYLKQLFGLPKHFYMGESKTTQYEVLGQSVDGTIMRRIYHALYDFLKDGEKSREIKRECIIPPGSLIPLPL